MHVLLRALVLAVVVLAVAIYLATRLPKPDEPVASKSEETVAKAEHAQSAEDGVTPKKKTEQESESTSGTDAPRFEKLDNAGQALPETAESWSCVRDNENRLVWEVKQNDGGLRDLDFTYSWYSSDGDVGVPDGGDCYYIFCDTENLVKAVNEEGLCGWHDWRLPTNLELMSLDTDRLYYNPDIDQRYFPNTRPSYYWTSTPAEVGPLSWSINFLNGFPEVSPRRLTYHVRLVRSD